MAIVELIRLLFQVQAYCFEEKGIVYLLKMYCSDCRIDCTLCQQFRFVQKSIV